MLDREVEDAEQQEAEHHERRWLSCSLEKRAIARRSSGTGELQTKLIGVPEARWVAEEITKIKTILNLD